MPKPVPDPLGPVRNPLAEAQLRRILGEAAKRSGRISLDHVALVDAWASRTADLYRCSEADLDLVVKVGHGWSAEEASQLDARLRRLRARLDASIVRVPEPFGWASEPPAVCMAYVTGTDLYFLVRNLAHPSWDSSVARATILARSGRALAHLHGIPREPTGAEAEATRARIRTVARSLAIRPILGGDLRIVEGLGDVGPHQFRIDTDGTVWVLDVPARQEVALAHEDIATFLVGIDKVVGMDGADRSVSRRASSAALQEAFLEGYAEAGGVDPRRPADRWLVRLFQAWRTAGLARRRITEGELIDAGRMLRRTLAGELWLRAHRRHARRQRATRRAGSAPRPHS